MLYYDQIDISEGIDFNKTSSSKECHICRYWYFIDIVFTFQPHVFNSCLDILMLFVSLNDIVKK